MLVSTKGRYALRIMLELGHCPAGERLSLPVIAQRQEISEKYLESIISVLVKAHLVEGLRGKNGGYRLLRPVEQYSVGEILRLTEGTLAPVACLEGESNPCPRCDCCATLPLWQELDRRINEYLDSVTLRDLMAQAGEDCAL